jgi:hypothetical protein
MSAGNSTSTPVHAPGNSSLETAIEYTRRGWRVIPVPFQTKAPVLKAWESLRLDEMQLPAHFSGRSMNVGVLMGEPSGWLIDVDLDHLRCVELADEYLPPTPAVFGRPGKPRSHRLYRVTRPVATKKHKSKSAGMLVEFRSTGLQTVFPPSIHVSGEAITWEDPSAEPLLVDPDELLNAVQLLADAVRLEIGEKSPSPRQKASREAARTLAHGHQGLAQVKTPDQISACVGAMLRMQMVDHNDGSSRLFAAACRTVEHGLHAQDALAAIRTYAQQRPFPVEWTDAQVLDRIRDAEQRTQRGLIPLPEPESGKKKILIDTDEHRVVNEVVDALTGDPNIFQRGGGLVRVLRESGPGDAIRRPEGAPTISFLPQPTLRERMTIYAQFTSLVRRKDVVQEVASHPTPWIVAAVDARGNWDGIRHLRAISDVPVLRADGSLWQTPGYDSQTGVLYEPSLNFAVIDDNVGLDDADAAAHELLDLVCDFKFESPEHQSAWLAGLLTPLARFAFDGPTPFFLVDANVRGAGKSLLVQTIGQIVLGREMPVSSYAHDPEEMRKKITAIALAGDRVIHLDNLEGSFGNDAIDRALTATRWKDRLLGKSQEVDLPLVGVWFGTGNNVSVAADTTRRIIHCRLDCLDEKPEERSGFKRPHLLAHIRQHRAQLLTYGMTILRAYCNAGLPSQNLSSFGSFEGWSRLVREAVVWAGLPDPCLTRTKLAEHSDATSDALGQLMIAWKQYDPLNEGIVVSDLVNKLYSREMLPRDVDSAAMRATLENLVGCPPGKAPGSRQVGAKLKLFRRRNVGGSYLDYNPDEYHRGGSVWRLHRA